MKNKINNCIVVSDIHAGCRLSLCPPEGAALDDGGRYSLSPLQKKLWKIWETFWGEWVPAATKNEPFCVVVNGDVVDGRHHSSTTQISENLEDQAEIAYQLLWPIVQSCEGRFYMTRGTEAHVGPSGISEEALAKRLGAVKSDLGQGSRYELRLRIGKALCHFSHHIGTTSSMAYETSAVMREMAEMFADAAKWRREPPDVICRSHRHRHVEVRVPTKNRYGIGFTTAAWQLRTPFSYRVPGGRVALPQIGGSLIRQGDREAFTEHFTSHIEPPPIEEP